MSALVNHQVRLAKRPEDIEPNLDFELDRFGDERRERLTISTEARAAFLAFATSTQAPACRNT